MSDTKPDTETMTALVATPGVPGCLSLQPADRPPIRPGEVVVRPEASSFNHGELRRAQKAAAGTRLGWDFVGEVVAVGPGVTALEPGVRVVGLSSKALGRGAWAEVIAVPAHAVAPLPDDDPAFDGHRFDVDAMATLPVAGLTALHSLNGDLLGRRVLVTGASGGVGSIAVQLAAAAGARVIAQVRRPERVDFAAAMGAHEVVLTADGAGFDGVAPVDRVVDGVGGPLLERAFATLRPGGTAVTYGAAHTAALSLSVWTFIQRSGATLEGLHLDRALEREPARIGLTRLLQLVAAGRLTPPVARVSDWREAGPLALDVLERRFPGKAVIRIG